MTSESGYISYPIVKGRDNNEYLRKAITGEPNILGTIYLDYRNQTIDDPFLVIYGHMMDTNAIFGSLKYFKKGDYTDTFHFYAPEKEFSSEPILASIISGETHLDPSELDSFESRQEFYQFLKENAVYDKNYELQEEDHLVLLSICTYESRNVRLVIVTVTEEMVEY